jgi:hypothetical protein
MKEDFKNEKLLGMLDNEAGIWMKIFIMKNDSFHIEKIIPRFLCHIFSFFSIE